jgi:hypothetical protein
MNMPNGNGSWIQDTQPRSDSRVEGNQRAQLPKHTHHKAVSKLDDHTCTKRHLKRGGSGDDAVIASVFSEHKLQG